MNSLEILEQLKQEAPKIPFFLGGSWQGLMAQGMARQIGRDQGWAEGRAEGLSVGRTAAEEVEDKLRGDLDSIMRIYDQEKERLENIKQHDVARVRAETAKEMFLAGQGLIIGRDKNNRIIFDSLNNFQKEVDNLRGDVKDVLKEADLIWDSDSSAAKGNSLLRLAEKQAEGRDLDRFVRVFRRRDMKALKENEERADDFNRIFDFPPMRPGVPPPISGPSSSQKRRRRREIRAIKNRINTPTPLFEDITSPYLDQEQKKIRTERVLFDIDEPIDWESDSLDL
eukprot:TRINITY_DN952_c0_g2_i1.p2 TRINITY_DN952_c0_g2~~TRINITY_DN952_c0_g2_i1.p2  ORF type:complete len:283 (-),score=40.51 TRINITY_DN952_c0_g2_i1:2565-3413(-)